MAQPVEKNELGRTAKRPVDIVAYLTSPTRTVPGRVAGRRRMAWLFRVNQDTWVWAAVALALGLFVTAQLQTRPSNQPVNQDYPRQIAQSTVERLEAEQSTLKLEIADLRRQIAVQQEQTARDKASFSAITASLKQEQVAAGLTPLVGPGIKVTLNDSAVKSIPAGEKPDNYLVHEYYLRDVINVLWASGAEAVSINGERVVGTTSIYCVGSTILANDTRMSPPYVIYAIGDAEALSAGLDSPVALLELKDSVHKYGVEYNAEPVSEAQLPAYNGTLHTKYAQPSADKPKAGG